MDSWPRLEVGWRDKDFKAAMDGGSGCLRNTPDPFNSLENLNLGQENYLNGEKWQRRCSRRAHVGWNCGPVETRCQGGR